MNRTPSDPFPWLRHRTWQEVLRTEELAAKADAGREKFTRTESSEFGRLMQKAYRHNPPPAPPKQVA